MFTYNTKDLMRKANCYYSLEIEGMENVHLRGAIFGYYKSGSDKEKDGNDRWPSDGLMLMKPGKMLKKMAEAIQSDVTDHDIEQAVNRLKNVIAIYGDEHGDNRNTPLLSIVKGELIGAYYLEDNHAADMGNLASSCMRHESCLPAFKIYEQNQDVISLLVLKSEQNKVIARALLWDVDGNYYMDTVYSISDNYRDLLIDYAKRHNFYWKSNQSCHHNVFDMRGNIKVDELLIVSAPVNFDSSWQVPYMDTMFNIVDRGGQHYATNLFRIQDEGSAMYRLRCTSTRPESKWTPSENYLLHTEVAFSLLHGKFVSDEAKKWSDENNGKDIPLSVLKDVIKSDESGNYDYKRYFLFEEDDEDEEENNEDEVYCEYIGEYRHVDDCVYVERGERAHEWILAEDAVEVRGAYWWSDDEDIVYVDRDGRYYHTDDTFYCEYNDRHYHNDDAIYVEDYGYVLSDDVEEVAVQIDDTWYNKDNCVQCEISEEWMMKGDEQVLPDGRKVTQDEYDNWMAENQEEEERP
jgi:hypothetical protein